MPKNRSPKIYHNLIHKILTDPFQSKTTKLTFTCAGALQWLRLHLWHWLLNHSLLTLCLPLSWPFLFSSSSVWGHPSSCIQPQEMCPYSQEPWSPNTARDTRAILLVKCSIFKDLFYCLFQHSVLRVSKYKVYVGEQIILPLWLMQFRQLPEVHKETAAYGLCRCRKWARFIPSVLIKLPMCRWNCSIQDRVLVAHCRRWRLNSFRRRAIHNTKPTNGCCAYCHQPSCLLHLVPSQGYVSFSPFFDLMVFLPTWTEVSSNCCESLEVITARCRGNRLELTGVPSLLGFISTERKGGFRSQDRLCDKVWQRSKNQLKSLLQHDISPTCHSHPSWPAIPQAEDMRLGIGERNM